MRFRQSRKMGCFTLSRQLDLNKFKDVFLNSLRVGEMWFRGVLLYVKKRKPEVTIEVTASDNKIHVTAQFVDYEHRYRYADEHTYSTTGKTHGLAYRRNQGFSDGTNLSTLSKLNFGAYASDGTFTYHFGSGTASGGYGTKSTKFYVQAWICYVDPETGKTALARSSVFGCTYNTLSQK